MSKFTKRQADSVLVFLIKKMGLTKARNYLGKVAQKNGLVNENRGRPAKFSASDKRKILSYISKYGLQGAKEHMEIIGMEYPSGPILTAWHQEAGLKVKRGRPVKETVEV